MADFNVADYDVPSYTSSSSYLKLDSGEKTTIRFLSLPVVGWQWWTEDEEGSMRPSRVRKDDEKDIDPNYKKDAKFFWSVVVLANEEIQVWTFTQRTVQTAIQNLMKSKSWGDPRGYDIVINKTGKGLGTEYSVMPESKKKTVDKIVDMYEEWKLEEENRHESMIFGREDDVKQKKTDDDDLPF